MTRAQTVWFLLAASIVIILAMVIASLAAPAPNTTFKDAAAVLAIVSATAVGIERATETMWTAVGMTANAWWPFTLVSKEITQLVDDLDANLGAFFQEAEASMQKVSKAENWSQVKADAAKKELDDLQARIGRLRELASDNQSVELIANTAYQNVSYLQQKYPDLEQAGTDAKSAVDAAVAFVATFKDNPARRLISLYLGALMGIVVAAVLGLDLFRAILQPTTAPSKPYLGIAFSGLVMGLGANPTHEVIRAVQEYKKSQKSDNALKPPPGVPSTQSDGSGNGA